MSQLSNALFSTTQQQLFGLLYGKPEKSFYLKELLRLTGMGVSTIKRELEKMLSAGILVMEKRGNQHHYQANPNCPIFNELRGIVQKTLGAADLITHALDPYSDRINWAFIFGSYASGKESYASDIDLMIIGSVDYTDVVKTLYPLQESLMREINPKIYSSDDWGKLKQSEDGFIKDVLLKPRINIVGDENGVR